MKNTNEIDGWFNYSNTFDFLISKVSISGIFVECGAWLGKSSSYLCDKCDPTTSIFIVDNWKGSVNELNSTQKLATQKDIYSIFMDNMGNRKFTPIVSDGSKAAEKFLDNSCDIVFIDMDHTYEAVKKDIKSWLPKVKLGGYIAGHDYTSDWIGVVNAVNETFPKDKILTMDTCWIYKKE